MVAGVPTQELKLSRYSYLQAAAGLGLPLAMRRVCGLCFGSSLKPTAVEMPQKEILK